MENAISLPGRMVMPTMAPGCFTVVSSSLPASASMMRTVPSSAPAIASLASWLKSTTVIAPGSLSESVCGIGQRLSRSNV